MLNKFTQDKPINRNNSLFDKYVYEQLHLPQNKVTAFHTDCKQTKKRICYCQYHPSNLIDEKSSETQDKVNRFLKVTYNGGNAQDIQRSNQKRELARDRLKRLQELEDLFYCAPKYESVVERWREDESKVLQSQIAQEQKKSIMQGQCYYCQTTHSSKFYEINPNPAETVVICEECASQQPNYAQLNPNAVARQETLAEKKKKRMEAQVKRLQTLQAKKLLRQGAQAKSDGQKKSDKQQDKDDDDDDSDGSESQKECNWETCKKKNKTDMNDTLICKGCSKSFHAECCDPPLEKEIVSKYDWYCTECKVCIKCQNNTKENELLMCDCCDRPFHMSCLTPARTDIPEGSWFCKDCESCASCGIDLFENDSRDQLKQYAKQQIDGKIICNGCWVHFQQKKYCPICCKIIAENAEGQFVYCEQCELWLHYDCEKKLSNRSFREINRTKYFICGKCKPVEFKR